MLLSVCIPTWNRCVYLRLSARLWLEQLAPFSDRVELIIADNASTDETSAVLKSLRVLGSFRSIRRPENLGFNRSTFDLVAKQAQGDFVWVCGDDDYLNPGGLAEVVGALEANQNLDHFYVATQFIPMDHAPDPGREDPRTSPYLRRPTGPAVSEVVARTSEIIEGDAGGLSGFYSSIWRRELAIEALSGDFQTREPFASLEATLPYPVFVARRRLAAPCCRIATPILTVVHTISWPQYAALFRLKMMPALYDLFERNGISDTALRPYRKGLLDHWPRDFIDLYRRRREIPGRDFSFTGFLFGHVFEAKFWRELGRYIWCDLLP